MALDLLATGLVLALVSAALVSLARRARRGRERLEAHGARVDGEVLQVWQDGTGSYCVRYRYAPEGAAGPITREEYAGCLRVSLPDVGERVTVRYDSQAPRRAYLERRGC